MTSTWTKAATAAALGILIVASAHAVQTAGAAAGPTYTKGGELIRPADYRTWIFLTSNINMGYPSAGAAAPAKDAPTMFGNVFVNPEAYQSFVRTGTWPDKTMMLIENRGSAHRPELASNSRFQTTDIHGLEFHVKDASRGGWTFYRIEAGKGSGEAVPRTAACYSCHQQNGAVDTTFVQYYPTLIDVAKQHHTYHDKESE